jgi:hypothetical protein
VIQVGQSLSSFPLAEGAGTPKDAEQEQRGAWQREMERAQLAAWLSHGIVGGGSMAPVAVTRSTTAAISNAGAGASVPACATASRTLARAAPATVFSVGSAGDLGMTFATDGAQARSGVASVQEVATPQDKDDAGRRRAQLMAGSHAQGAAGVQLIAAYADGAAPAKNLADPLASGIGAPRLLAAVSATLDGTQANQEAVRLPGPHVPANGSIAHPSAPPVGLPPNNSAPHAGFVGQAVGTPLTEEAARITLEEAGRITPLPRRGHPQVATAREFVRIHAEWVAEGVRVWLGLDAAALAYQEAIVQHVRRWAAAQGGRVLSLSCNGRSLVVSDASEGSLLDSINDQPIHVKEQPWPSVR